MTWRLACSLLAALVLTLLMPASEALARCCGASCCRIEGDCFTTGEANPDNPCEMCDPSSAPLAWTAVPGCTPPEDAGMSMPDAGPTDEDAGTPAEEDAGTPAETDAGTTPEVDSGTTPTADAGSGDDSGDDDGGCAAGGSGAFGGLFGLLLLGLRRKQGALR